MEIHCNFPMFLILFGWLCEAFKTWVGIDINHSSMLRYILCLNKVFQ